MGSLPSFAVRVLQAPSASKYLGTRLPGSHYDSATTTYHPHLSKSTFVGTGSHHLPLETSNHPSPPPTYTIPAPLRLCRNQIFVKTEPQAQPQPRPEELDLRQEQSTQLSGQGGWPRLQNEPPGAVPRIHKTKGDGFLGRGRMLDYLWRWSGGRRTRNSFQVGV